MMKFFVALSIAALGLSGFLLVTFLEYASVDRRPPVANFLKVETLTSPIRAGDMVHVRIWRDKAREDCPVSSDRVAINQDGQAFVLPSGVSAGGPAGGMFFDFRYPTLPEMPQGEYQLRVDLAYKCPGGLIFRYTQPSAFFRITG